MKRYKVWVQIEEMTTDENGLDEEFQDHTEPECLGIFNTPEEAEAFMDGLERGEGAF